jgi:hypothetical protein
VSEDWKQIAREAWNAPSWHEAARDYHKSRSAPPRRDDPDLQRLRKLLDDGVTLVAAWAAMHRNRPAPETTIEAIMFSLRRGVNELARPDTKHRLAELSEDQLRAVCKRLRNFKPETATAWTPEEIGALAAIWSELK